METISLKMDREMLETIDSSLKRHNYSTRTEFIRAAIREKIQGMAREERIEAFLGMRGKAKKKTTYEDDRKVREIVSKELDEYLDKKLK